MLRKVFLRILAVPIALFGSRIAAWFSGDPKASIFTGRQLIITSVFLLGLFILAAWLETSRSLVWNWPWHRFWFFRDLVNHEQTRAHKIFHLHPDKEAALAEVLENRKRRNLLALLLDKMARLNPVPRIFITGEGGSGKTTTMEQLRLNLAREGSKRLGFGKPIPVLVRMGSVSSGKLLDNVREFMEKGSPSSKVLSKGLDDLLRKGRIALLIDSVDESLGQNPNAFREIVDLIESADYKLSPVIVSGRRGEYEQRLPAFVEPLNIEELGDEAVLYICNEHANKRDGQSPDDIFSTLRRNGLLDSAGLGRNPFWLKLILQGGTFENNKPKIFDDAIDSVLRREWDKAGKKTFWKRHFDADEQLLETRSALAKLAEEVSKRNQGESIDGLDALRVVDNYLSGRTGVANVLRAQDVLWLGLDAQLLYFPPLKSSSDWPPVRFNHRLIREYLTANLLSKPPALLEQAFENHAGDTEWWEILLMAETISASIGPARQNLLKVTVGDAKDVKRVFFAVAMLGHPRLLYADLKQPPISLLIENLSQGVTAPHIDAAIRIADIAPERLVAMLERLSEFEDAGFAETTKSLLTKMVENEVAKVSTGRLVPGLLASTKLKDVVITKLVSIGSPAVEHVLPVLRDSDIMARWNAVEVLGDIRDRAAVTPLLDLLYDANTTVRNSAIEALGKIGDPIAIPHFARMLNSLAASEYYFFLSVQVSKALGDMGEPAIEHLANMLQDNDSFLPVFAADALKQIGKPAVPAVIRALKNVNMFTLPRVATWLAEVQAVEAIEPLLALLKKNPSVMQFIKAALVKYGDAAVEPVISFVNDADFFHQSLAMNTLAQIGGDRVYEVLIGWLNTPGATSNSLREAAETVMRANAAEALGILKDARATGALQSAARDENWLIRIKASSALIKLGQDEALEGVLKGLEVNNLAVITVAIHELRQLKQTRSLIYLERFIRTVTKSGVENAPLSPEMQERVDDAVRAVETITLELSGVSVDKEVQTNDAEEPPIEVSKEKTPAERDFRGYAALLKHPEESMREDAAIALNEVDNPPFELVRIAVEDSSQRVRVHAMRLAGRTGRVEGRQLLADRLQHDNHIGVRMMAAEALGNFDDDDVRALLREALTDKYPLVEIGAAAGLAKLGDKNMYARLADLAEQNEDPVFKSIAVGVYEDLKDPASIPYLERLLEQCQAKAVTPEDESRLQTFRDILESLQSLQSELPKTFSDKS